VKNLQDSFDSLVKQARSPIRGNRWTCSMEGRMRPSEYQKSFNLEFHLKFLQ
jgi:hypothetical protein